MIPLFEKFPGLRAQVPYEAIGCFPTPIRRLDRLSEAAPGEIWIKDDGRTHPVYGGNKVRKLEFVLGDALRRGAKRIVTGGGIGSNQTVALAMLASKFGIRTSAALMCAPITDTVRKNILLGAQFDVRSRLGGSLFGMVLVWLLELARCSAEDRRFPKLVLPGASDALGVLGFASGALELERQIEDGEAPPFDAVFVAVGSCGTFSGLLLAKWLFGHPWDLHGVRIIEPGIANPRVVRRKAIQAHRYLKARVELPPLREAPIVLEDGFVGRGYGYPTEEGRAAIELAADLEKVQLEPCYTAKTLAAALAYARAHPDQRVLFWNTYSAHEPKLDLAEVEGRLTPAFRAFATGERPPCLCPRYFVHTAACPKREGTASD